MLLSVRESGTASILRQQINPFYFTIELNSLEGRLHEYHCAIRSAQRQNFSCESSFLGILQPTNQSFPSFQCHFSTEVKLITVSSNRSLLRFLFSLGFLPLSPASCYTSTLSCHSLDVAPHPSPTTTCRATASPQQPVPSNRSDDTFFFPLPPSI